MIAQGRHGAPLKAIIFDLDGTLWDTGPALARAEQAVHAWLAQRYPVLARGYSIAELRALRAALARQYPYLRHDVTALRKASLSIAATQLGLDPRLADEAFGVFISHRNRVSVYDDVLPVLRRLRRRYTLCSLTNGNADLAVIGLDGLFHHSLSAAQARAAKPASEIFFKVCALAGAHPQECVHVGDEPEADMAGAAAAGCRTVWLNRADAPWPYSWRPDAVIRSLQELETLFDA